MLWCHRKSQKAPKDPLFFKKNSWRVLHQVPHVTKYGFDFARRCGEVMMPQNRELRLWVWFRGEVMMSQNRPGIAIKPNRNSRCYDIITSPHRRAKSNPCLVTCGTWWRTRRLLFFWKKSGSLGTFWDFRWYQSTKWRHYNTFSDIISIFSKKKYVFISPRSGAHVGERNLFLSAIRRSYRRSKFAYLHRAMVISLSYTMHN